MMWQSAAQNMSDTGGSCFLFLNKEKATAAVFALPSEMKCRTMRRISFCGSRVVTFREVRANLAGSTAWDATTEVEM